MKPTRRDRNQGRHQRMDPLADLRQAGEALDESEPLLDPGRSLALRLLALVGAFSFLMLGLASVLVPLLQQPTAPPQPQPRNSATA